MKTQSQLPKPPTPADQSQSENTLFVMLPENIDDLLKVTEKSTQVVTDFARGFALYHYLFDRRKGLTHSEALAELKTLDYAEAERDYRTK